MKPASFLSLPICGLLAVSLPSCISVKTEHEVKPIEININVKVQVEQELDNFFEDLDDKRSDLAN